MGNSIRIFVASHSEKDIKNIKSDNIYVPLFVGRNGKDNFGFCSDDSGENISHKNTNYCELTGLYWMWKNTDFDFIGLIHYRRYFAKNKLGKRLDGHDLEDIFKNYDIILPKKSKVLLDTVYEDYDHWHYAKDLDVCEDIIKELYPEYAYSYNKVILENNYLYYSNMFITSKEIFNRYCEWIFPILAEVESRIDLDGYSDYQKRLFGFLSERLFSVWVDKQNLKVKQCDVRITGLAVNIRKFIFQSRIVRGIYRFYLAHINPNVKRRY